MGSGRITYMVLYLPSHLPGIMGVKVGAGTLGEGSKSLEDLLGGKRKLREAFSLPSCKGSVKLRDSDGNVYVVNATEINVNFKPSSIELVGSCCFYLYRHSTKQSGDHQLLAREGQIIPSLATVGSVFETPCQVQAGNVIMTVLLVLGCVVLALILGFLLISRARRNSRGQGLNKIQQDTGE